MNSIIAILENFNLGLSRDGTVTLLPHNPLWAEAAKFELDRLSKNVENTNFSFHHIGSTSIPNISAKPILDLLVLAPSLAAVDERESVFTTLGYEYKGEYGIPGRRYCVLYNEDKTKGYVHLHAFQFDNVEASQHLLFRDYLRSFPDVASEYEKIKLELNSDKNINRPSYTAAKDPFIKKVLLKAQEWEKGIKKSPVG